MPDEFDKPLSQTEMDEFGEEPEVPFRPATRATHYNRDLSEKTLRLETLARPARMNRLTIWYRSGPNSSRLERHVLRRLGLSLAKMRGSPGVEVMS